MNLFTRLSRTRKSAAGSPILAEHDNQDAFVRAAYRAVLRRAPDKKGLIDYSLRLAQGRLTPAGLLGELTQSEEFKTLTKTPRSTGAANHTERNPKVAALSRHRDILQRSRDLADYTPFTEGDLDSGAKGLVGLEYYELHKRRFLEMINALAFVERKLGTPLNILEIGSIFTTYIIKSTFPGAKISTVDVIGLDKIGYGDVYMLKDLVEGHHQIDLVRDKIEDIAIDGGEKFDIILLCEVIEHLLLNPTKLLRFLLRQLKPGGYLYITTPNAFKRGNLEAFQRCINPFTVYPEAYGYEDAHMFHVREYGMGELLEYSEAAGAVVKAFYFSNCWDPSDAELLMPANELSNLVVLIQKPKASR